MPGRLFLETPMAEIGGWIGQDATSVNDEAARLNIQPGQEVVVLTSNGFHRMRWGIIPVGRVNARGRPVMETIINARSESVFHKSAFDGVQRAVVIVDGWYEWTGKARRKTAWRIFGETPLIFAAICDVWKAPGGTELHQMATVTCEPNEDVARIHHRMGVLLNPDEVPIWLNGDQSVAAALCHPWPNGRLTIEEASNVDWSAA